MRLPLTLLAVLATASFIIAGCHDTLPPGPKPGTLSDTIAWYRHPLVDGKDATGHGHDGSWPLTLPPSVLGKDRFGKVDLSSHAPVVVTNTKDLNFNSSNSYTISGWVELFQTGGPVFIVAKTPNSQPPVGYQLQAGPNGQVQVIINDSLDPSKDLRIQTSNLLLENPDTSGALTPGGWHLVTLSVKAHTSCSLYVDSVLVSTRTDGMATMASDVSNDGTPMVMGGFLFLVDDILILNRTVDANWVDQRFHEGGWYKGRDQKPASHAGIWTVPAPGTMFVFTPGIYGANDTIVIKDTGLSVQGKNNVVTFDTLHSPSTTGFLSYESNNDISIGDSGNNWTYWQPAWRTFVGTNRIDTVVAYDTTVHDDFLGRDVRYRTLEVLSYVGSESLSVLGRTIATLHLREDWYQMTDDKVNSSSVSELWMSPELGFWVKTHTEYWQNGHMTVAFDRNLTGYGKL